MATITAKKRADGSAVYKAEVRVKRNGQIVYRESRQFDQKRQAESWAKRLELELENPAALSARLTAGLSVKDAITRYMREVDPIKRFGDSKRSVLGILQLSHFADKAMGDLTDADVIEHCRRRKTEGAGPVTVNMDVIYLRTVLRYAETVWKMPPGAIIIEHAMPMLKQLGLVGKSRRRDRRLEPGEYEALKEFFEFRWKSWKSVIPMHELFAFAVASAMRLGEIVRIRWDDIDELKRTVVIRDRKDPNNKEGNDQIVPLLGEAWNIVQRQPKPKDAEFIFPYKEESISSAFTKVVKFLDLKDLRFHDLRHEAACRLFEAGYAIEEVAIVTGHKSWDMLKRYTHLRPEDLHRDRPAPERPALPPAPPPTPAQLATAKDAIVYGAIRDKIRAGGNPVKLWRESRGITQRDISEQLGILPSRISEIEHDLDKVSLGLLRQLAVLLEVPLPELIPEYL